MGALRMAKRTAAAIRSSWNNQTMTEDDAWCEKRMAIARAWREQWDGEAGAYLDERGYPTEAAEAEIVRLIGPRPSVSSRLSYQ